VKGTLRLLQDAIKLKQLKLATINIYWQIKFIIVIKL